MFSLDIADSASADLENLDAGIRKQILKKLYWFLNQGNPLYFAKRLSGSFYGKYRFRVGNYRIIFKIDNHEAITVLIVLRIKHRREVYD